jgi:N-acetylglucosaminyldiphosphoundecaprenol N-acetyl-beta-D-mannosaminyltransferase
MLAGCTHPERSFRNEPSPQDRIPSSQNLLKYHRFSVMHTKANHKRKFLGVPIDLVSMSDVLAAILQWREARRFGYVTLINPHSVLVCARDRVMRSAVLNSSLALPDGVGITIASHLLGYSHNDRVAGPSLMLNLCDFGRSHGLRHFFYGGAEGVAVMLAERLAALYPGLIICGVLCPPFLLTTPAEDTELVERINDASPDIVWVGLGTGKQEKWMADHVSRVCASAMLGVGAAFDFHAGTVSWAPLWIRRVGCEWAYRLAQEPRRLWRRNLDGLVFLARIVGQRIMSKSGDDAITESSAGQMEHLAGTTGTERPLTSTTVKRSSTGQ